MNETNQSIAFNHHSNEHSQYDLQLIFRLDTCCFWTGFVSVPNEIVRISISCLFTVQVIIFLKSICWKYD